MKFTILSAAGILAAISQASAIEIVTPWADTVWTAGGHGNITWKTTAADAGLKCDIYMLNGDIKNSNIVAQVTDPATPIDCSVGIYDIHPLGDFANGKYSIRIGQAATASWAYSSLFTFKGNALAPGAANSATANGTAPVIPNANGAKPSAIPTNTAALKANGTQSASAPSSSTSTSGSESSLNMNSAAIALGAIAAIAFSL
ncbi:hypothetical protein MFLAVUS_006335 [Mucor flavus]|uniref:Yeast cell wall synthesis Kre9/Knh1-like N-terminal domain-containing protein n=1 Tax=Mucor flavus TaxID=439312 RepID=A0ABP9Z182_9FUNG